MNPIGGRIISAFFPPGYDVSSISCSLCHVSIINVCSCCISISCGEVEVLRFGHGSCSILKVCLTCVCYSVNRKTFPFLSGRKQWTFPPLSGFWLISAPLTKPEAERGHSRSQPTAGPGNSNVKQITSTTDHAATYIVVITTTTIIIIWFTGGNQRERRGGRRKKVGFWTGRAECHPHSSGAEWDILRKMLPRGRKYDGSSKKMYQLFLYLCLCVFTVAFQLYDQDRDGKISRDELLQVRQIIENVTENCWC